jgi:capsid protein
LNWLDKTIGFISPSWGYRRNAWRQAVRGFYDSGNTDRLNSGWTPVNGTAEQTDQPQRDIIRARARDLERNSDIAEAIIGPLERNVVGTGIKVQAKVSKPDGTEDETLNQQIEDLWNEWCRPRNCDVTGQQSFEEMQAMVNQGIDTTFDQETKDVTYLGSTNTLTSYGAISTSFKADLKCSESTLRQIQKMSFEEDSDQTGVDT